VVFSCCSKDALVLAIVEGSTMPDMTGRYDVFVGDPYR
jgi:hypothetical protein